MPILQRRRAPGAALAIIVASTAPALAHEFYDQQCCADQHCRPVPCAEVVNTAQGWQWHGVNFTRAQLKQSPDGACHVCVQSGQNGVCIYLPRES